LNKSLTNSELVLARKIESNFMNSFRYMHGIDGALFWEDKTATGFLTNYPESYMNWVQIFNIDLQSPESDVKQVLTRYKERQCALTWYVGAHTSNPATVKECLHAEGFTNSVERNSIGMVLDQSKFVCSTPLPELRIKEIDRESSIKDFLVPFQLGFSISDVVTNLFGLYIKSRLGHSQRENWFIGYVNDTPVSAAGYFIDDGVAMIHSVATLPAFRKHGYARRLTEASICAALTKSQLPVTLYAGTMGRNLYLSIGFSEVYVRENYRLQTKHKF